MNSHTTLILFIVMVTITAGGIVVMQEITQNAQQKAGTISSASGTDSKSGDIGMKPGITLVNTVGTDVQNSTYKYVEVQVRYSGSQPLNLNDTTIQIMTSESEANLQYRNGTPYRDMNGGFYTQ